MCPKDTDGMANIVDPNQSAPSPLVAVWSRSALFDKSSFTDHYDISQMLKRKIFSASYIDP